MVPSSTSWCATSPRRRTEWIGMPSTRPPRAPSAATDCVGSSPQSFDAAGDALRGQHRGARRRVDLLVVVQLDDLAALEVGRGELREPHHQHRADREVRRDDGIRRRLGRTRRRARRSSSSPKPVVPTTAWMPFAAHQRRFSRAASMTVKSTATSASASHERAGLRRHLDLGRRGRRADAGRCPAWCGSTAATSSMSGASCTAWQTVEPMRPPAPNTPTRIMADRVPPRACQCSVRQSRSRRVRAARRLRASAVRRAALGRSTRATSSAVTASTRASSSSIGRHFALDLLGAPDATHAARRRLERHGERTRDVALRGVELGARQAVAHELGRAASRTTSSVSCTRSGAVPA